MLKMIKCKMHLQSCEDRGCCSTPTV